MRVGIGVFAEPPLPGRCRTKLLAAHGPEWTAGLYAAMLRDTLDGLQSLDASDYLVFCSDGEDDAAKQRGRECLERHVHAPWEIVTDEADASSALARLGASESLAILARSDAPSAPIDVLAEAIVEADEQPFVALGATDGGDAWLLALSHIAPPLFANLPWGSPELAATIRVRCNKAKARLVELPTTTVVEHPSGVVALLDELRRHPERAPRTAPFMVTRG
jgi:glycosyltransferase A (GT-A) superfamily protein (DUF2064 family)